MHQENNYLFKIFVSESKKALRRNILWDLSFSSWMFHVQKNCYYCGNSPEKEYKTKKHYFKYSGLDRIDNEQGYREGNIVACCKICNYMKGQMTHQEFIDQVRIICKYTETL